MKTITATQKPSFNEWIKFIYKEVRRDKETPIKSPEILDLRTQIQVMNKH